MLKHYLIVILLMLTLPVMGQINIQFVPELYGRNIDGLFGCNIISNSTTRQSGSMTITVSEKNAGTVCIIKTPVFSISTGSNAIPYSAARSSSIQFSGNTIGRLISVNHVFPEGQYEYCYSFSISGSDNNSSEQCFDYTLAPFAQLNLIDPYDKDKICDTRPLLSWQPLVPAISGSYYQLVLTQENDGQSATDAINYNLPLINQSQLTAPVLPYPSIAKDLQKGKKYAWQVTAYKDQTVLNRSDIWDFTVDCQDTIKKTNDDGYRDIEDLSKGNYYIAVMLLKFAFVNPYQAQNLKYEITSLNNPDKKVKGLPRVKITTGLNQISIDLSLARGLTDDSYYLLKIWLPNGTIKNLRFLYEEAK